MFTRKRTGRASNAPGNLNPMSSYDHDKLNCHVIEYRKQLEMHQLFYVNI